MQCASALQFRRLERGTAEGDVLGTSVTISIQLQYNGGGYTTVKTDTISGRTADKYERDYLVDINGAFPVDLRVDVKPNAISRLTPS
jgi:predicted phage tail protein